MSEPESFSERLRRLREERGVTQATPSLPETPKLTPVDPATGERWADDLIPDVQSEKSESDLAIETTLDRVSVVQAYRKWINKKIDQSTLKRDEIIMSCPMPNHPDNDPSAWMNAKDKTWFCGGCQLGGDFYDFAAIAHNLPVMHGKYRGQEFMVLRETMAEDFGTHIKRVANNEEVVWYEEDGIATPDTPPVLSVVPPLVQPEPSQVTAPAAPPITTSQEDATGVVNAIDNSNTPNSLSIVPDNPEPVIAPVVPIEPDTTDEVQVINYPILDWRSIVPEGTFLYEYMVACSVDDSPEEYHFWNGMLALGHTVGRNVVLADDNPAKANLLVCMLGPTGAGKTKSTRYLDRLLHEVLPFEGDKPVATGVKVIPQAGSGEFLVAQFTNNYQDVSLGKSAPLMQSPVNGIVNFDEFAALLARANRQGSTLKTVLMQMGDAGERVSLGSLTGGVHSAIRPFCSVTTSTQPKSIRTLVTKQDAGSGFLNRWLFVSGGLKEKVVFGSAEVDLTRAVDRLREIKAWGAVSRKILIEADALQNIIDWYQGTIYPARANDDTDLLARTDLIMKKMMLLLTINNKELAVTNDTLQRIKPIYHYLVQCYGLINAEIGISLNYEVGEDITRVIKTFKDRNNRPPSVRDIGRSLARKKYTPQQLKQTLDNMLALDLIELIKPKAGQVGKPTIRYDIAKDA